MIPLFAGLAVAIPFLAALLGPAIGRRACVGLVCSASAAAAVLAGLVLLGTGPVREWSTLLTPTGGIDIVIGVRVDELSATIGVMVTIVACAVQVYSVGYLRDGPRYRGYAATVSLFTSAMLLVVFSADLLVTYVGWEVMGLCSYLLIGYRWERPADTAAAIKAFLLTKIGDVALLIGIFTLGTAAGSFRISAVLASAPHLSPATLLAATLLLVVGVLAKSAQFPLHSWLPDAMAGPAPVSALIHAATMVAAGAYLLARLYPVVRLAPVGLAVLAVLAGLSMLGAAVAALAVDDLKRVLAYSTISQLGFVLVGISLGAPFAALAQLVAHAAFKAVLFLGAGAVLAAVGSTAFDRIGALRGRLRITFVTMTIGFAALAGIPPTAGFVSKDVLLAAISGATSVGGPVAVFGLVCAVATIPVTACYATRAWRRTFFGPRRTRPEQGTPPSMSWPMIALALPALLLGAVAFAVPGLRPDPVGAVISVGLVLIGVLAGFGRIRVPYWHIEVDVVPAVLAVARGVARADDRLLAGPVTGTARTAERVGDSLRHGHNGNVRTYLGGVVLGTLAIAVGVVALR